VAARDPEERRTPRDVNEGRELLSGLFNVPPSDLTEVLGLDDKTINSSLLVAKDRSSSKTEFLKNWIREVKQNLNEKKSRSHQKIRFLSARDFPNEDTQTLRSRIQSIIDDLKDMDQIDELKHREATFIIDHLDDDEHLEGDETEEDTPVPN
jgi:hypothetical protein